MTSQTRRPSRRSWEPIRAGGFEQQKASSGDDWWPPFPAELPPQWAVYEPKHPITKKLKKLIEDHSYAGAFQSAIDTVVRQRVQELDRIKNLYQFYYYVDSLVTWM